MKAFAKILGYSFENPKLLELALTHRSFAAENNERLEFLGDAILGYILTHHLYHLFPNAQEGELSRFRAHCVNEETLAEIAQKFELGQHLKLGSGELKSGGYRRKSILADALEAIIGAIYLDSDISQCEKVILKWFEERIQILDKLENVKDAKSRLQEYLQSHKIPLPQYTILSVTGDAHAFHFQVRCEVEGLDYHSEGIGSSRRAAEQIAAEAFLLWLLKL
jgi:ribonuclease-3